MTFTVEERKKYLQDGFEINERDELEKYIGTAKTINIPEGIVEIGMSAFSQCNMTKVSVPSSVKRIKFHGFNNCEKLKEIKLSEGLEEIADAVFFYCDKLQSIHIPQSVKKIGARSFMNCKKLTSCELSSNLEEIADHCFFGTAIESIIVPRKVTRIGTSALACKKLVSVVLPPNLQEIGDKAFIGCEKLEQVSIPISVRKLGQQVFDTSYIKLINYEGTKDQWDKIEKGERNDYFQIIKFNVPYNYGEWTTSVPPVTKQTETFISTNSTVSKVATHCEEQKVGARYIVDDAKTQNDLDKLFAKLSEFYPEHKIFAFDNLVSHEREKLSKITKTLGLSSYQPILQGYGFEIITPEQTKQLRDKVIYTVGNEPDVIKNKVDNALKSLETYYPSKIIERSVQTDHPNLASSLSGLYQWLGYEDLGAFLAAYGYQYNLAVRESIELYSTEIVEEIKRRYQGKTIFTVKQLLDENPDIASKIYGVSQSSQKLFGMTWSDYLTSLGILADIWETRERAFNEFVRIAKERFPNGYPCQRVSALVEACPELEPFVEQATYFCAKRRDVGLKEYLQSQGIMVPQQVVKKQTKPVIAEPNVAVYAQEFGIPLDEIQIGNDGYYITDKNRLEGYIGRAKHIVIPFGVKEIGQGAFQGHLGIETVIIPGTVKKISQFAFKNCCNLKRVIIEEGLTIIGQYVFSFCDNLRDIRLPASYTKANPKSFNYGQVVNFAEHSQYHIEQGNIMEGSTLIRWLASHGEILTVPTYVERIGESAFRWDTQLKEIVIPEHIKEIGEEAFLLCSSLTKAICRAPITTLAQGMFVDCTSLLEVELPDTIEIIQTDAFANCENLQKLNIPKSLKQFDRDTFYNSKLEILPQKGKWILNECDLDDDDIEYDWGESFECYVKVKFDDGKAFIYYSENEICVGDRVKVEGKRSDEIGTVVEIKDERYDYPYDEKYITDIVESPVTLDTMVVIRRANSVQALPEDASQKEIDTTVVRCRFDDNFLLPIDELKKYKVGDEIDAVQLLLRRDLPDGCESSSLHSHVFFTIEFNTNSKSDEEFQQELAKLWEPTVMETMQFYHHAIINDIDEVSIGVTLYFEQICGRRITELVNKKIVKSNFLEKYYDDGYDFVTYDYPWYLDEREMTMEYYDIYLLDDVSEQARKNRQLGCDYGGSNGVWEKIDISGIKFYNYIKHQDEGDYSYDLSHRIERITEKDGKTELYVKMTLECKYIG